MGLLQPRPLVSAISATICTFYTDVALTHLLEDKDLFEEEVTRAEVAVVQELDSRELTIKSLLPAELNLSLIHI